MSIKIGEQLANNGATAALTAASEWSLRADMWLDNLIIGDTFTSEDLTNEIGFPNPLTMNDNNAVGAKIRTWSLRAKTKRRGYAKTTRSKSHSRMIVIWEKA